MYSRVIYSLDLIGYLGMQWHEVDVVPSFYVYVAVERICSACLLLSVHFGSLGSPVFCLPFKACYRDLLNVYSRSANSRWYHADVLCSVLCCAAERTGDYLQCPALFASSRGHQVDSLLVSFVCLRVNPRLVKVLTDIVQFCSKQKLERQSMT